MRAITTTIAFTCVAAGGASMIDGVARATPLTAAAAMPAADQTALVKQYCAVCHTDAVRNGGLSLEHYDAARRDPPLAAMILSKLNNGAMGAAGKGVPEPAAQQAWMASTRAQAAGAQTWFVSRDDGAVSASIVRDVPPRTPGVTERPVYRYQVTCTPSTRSGTMQLTWSPQPQTGRTLAASVDGGAPVAFTIVGTESMGNGGRGQSGHASVVLSGGKGGTLALGTESLTIRDLFPGERVEFPLSELDRATLAELRACF